MIDSSKLEALKGVIRKPHVNSSCIGCAACAAISGDVFTINDDGLSSVLPCASYEGKDVDDAIAACPVNSISWQQADENGNYLNGLEEHKDA